MKKAHLISIGNEIINGDILDSNSSWLSRQLASCGIETIGIQAVGDDIRLIYNALENAAKQADIILTTGGLGPTDDDITRDAIADFANVKLVLKQDIVDKIQSFFRARNIQMPQKNTVQAMIPQGLDVLDNNAGTAPGFAGIVDKIFVASMPGVPTEMKLMFTEAILPKLKDFSDGKILKTQKIKIFGLGESTVAEMLGDLMNRTRNPLINCTVSGGIITLHIISKADNTKAADEQIKADTQLLQNILGDWIYAVGDYELADVVGNLLLKKNKTVCLAESCTGGLVSKMITDSSGASQYFKCGWVCYCNDVKADFLGVDKNLIEKYGAVSAQVAEKMAIGALEKSKTDYAISITGIAGPTGGTEQKPIGLVYICVADKKEAVVEEYKFSRRTREFVRLRAAQSALNQLRMKLLVD